MDKKRTVVEQTLIKRQLNREKQLRKSQWQEGAKDPLLMKDIEDTNVAFYTADNETAREIK